MPSLWTPGEMRQRAVCTAESKTLEAFLRLYKGVFSDVNDFSKNNIQSLICSHNLLSLLFVTINVYF